MGRAKEIVVKVIPSSIANPFVKQHHYSGKVVNNSCLHFGAFLDGKLHGVMSFGPSMNKHLLIGVVSGTSWNEFLELNRMAFDEYLPRNSESRCISIALRLIKKNAPQIKWVVSFADGCSCGDGTIYRASGFVLTQVKQNGYMYLLPNGEKICKTTISAGKSSPRPELGGLSFNDLGGRFKKWVELSKAKLIDGYMLRYIYFLDPTARERLTVPILPFSRIDEIGAGMYQGKKITRAERHEVGAQGSELNRRITRGTDAS